MANNNLNKGNLGFLGIEFQYKLISTFFIDQGFCPCQIIWINVEED